MDIEEVRSEIKVVRSALKSFADFEDEEERRGYLRSNDELKPYLGYTEEELKKEKHLLQEKENLLLAERVENQDSFTTSSSLPSSGNGRKRSRWQEDSDLRTEAAPSEPEHQQFRFKPSVCGEYLEVELPVMFARRYGDVPSSIYIRRCYRELYNLVSERMLDSDIKFPAFLFTGVPGIGKSVFLIYFLFRFLRDDRFPDKRFMLELKPGDYNFFVPTTEDEVKDGVFKFKYSRPSPAQVSCPLLEVPIFSDILTEDEPGNRGKWLFLFSSPNPRRYRGMMSMNWSYRYTLPTWSESEMLQIDPFRYAWIDRFSLFGGVPRILFRGDGEPDPEVEVEHALTSKGPVIAETFFKFGFRDEDLLNNHMLLHINPPKCPPDADYGWFYDEPAGWSFASPEIAKRIAEKNQDVLIKQTVEMYKAGVPVPPIRGFSVDQLFK